MTQHQSSCVQSVPKVKMRTLDTSIYKNALILKKIVFGSVSSSRGKTQVLHIEQEKGDM